MRHASNLEINFLQRYSIVTCDSLILVLVSDNNIYTILLTEAEDSKLCIIPCLLRSCLSLIVIG